MAGQGPRTCHFGSRSPLPLPFRFVDFAPPTPTMAGSWPLRSKGPPNPRRRTGACIRAEAMRLLTAIPVYNEQAHLAPVLNEVLRFADEVLVVDDGSTDATPELLAAFPQIQVIRHPKNLGYGAG